MKDLCLKCDDGKSTVLELNGQGIIRLGYSAEDQELVLTRGKKYELKKCSDCKKIKKGTTVIIKSITWPETHRNNFVNILGSDDIHASVHPTHFI